MEEVLLLVNDDDVFLGYAPRQECHKGDGRHHRAFVILIFNKDKKLLLQKRRHELWDNYWDLTAASHVLCINGKDETYEEAGNRCLKNEWGFKTELRKLFGYNYFERFNGRCENEFCMLLVGEYNDKLIPNEKHAHGFKWVTLNELITDTKKNPKNYTPWAIIAVKELMKHPEHKKFF